jgi:hypothetical protein
MIQFTGKEDVDELIDVIVRNSGMSRRHAIIAVAYSFEWASDYASRHYGALHAAADLGQMAHDVDPLSLEYGNM